MVIQLRLIWSSSDVTAATLVLLSLLTSAVITISRVGFGHIEWAASSRYTTLGTLGIAGFYMLLLRDHLLGVAQEPADRAPLRSRLFSALLALLFVGLVTANSEGVAMGKAERERRAELQLTLLTFETQSDEALQALLPWEGVRNEARFLKAAGLSVFRPPGRQPRNALRKSGAGPP